jgi:ABC-type glycerol-3-phosphate transport system substrate-binding protein
MKANKWLTLSIAAIISLTLLIAGCSKSGSNSQESSTSPQSSESTIASESPSETAAPFQLGSEDLKFSFYGNYDWYSMQPWGEDPASKWIKENKKVTVEAISAGGAPDEKLNTMIASDSLPDVLFLERGAGVERLRKAGKLVPLDGYLEKYPNLKQWISPAALNLLKSEDGHLYQFPNWYTNSPIGNGGYIINKKIYKALGSPKLETFDDFYAYLKQVKVKYPDVVPFEPSIKGQGIDVLYPGFANDHPVLNISMRGVPNGDKLTSIFTDPVYKETMQYASKLFREKLITQDALTQTLDQVVERVTTGRVAVAAAFNITNLGKKGNTALTGKDPDAGYEIVWPLRKDGVDKDKVRANQYDVLGWNVNVITTSAKNPEAIFAYLDWHTGEEGQRIITWGPEGLYWQGTDENGAPKFTPKFFADEKEYSRLYGVWDTFTWSGNTSFQSKVLPAVLAQYPAGKKDWASEAQTTVTQKTSLDVTAFINLDPSPESDEGIIAQKVDDIFTEMRAKILFSKNDAEVTALLDKAEKDANAAGYDKLLAFKTQKWQDNLKKINGN